MIRSEEIQQPKVILVGNSGVGKTSIVRGLINSPDNAFDENETQTLGAYYASKLINHDSARYNAQIWDIGGRERYANLRPNFYIHADYCLLTFDVCSSESFNDLQHYKAEVLKARGCQNVKFILVGNKADKGAEDRCISKKAAEEYAERQGMLDYVETSAKTNQGIDEITKVIANNIALKLDPGTSIYTPQTQAAIALLSTFKETQNLYLHKYFERADLEARGKTYNSVMKMSRYDVALILQMLQRYSYGETIKNYAVNILLGILILATFIVSLPYLWSSQDNIYKRNKREHGNEFLFFTNAPKQALEVALNLSDRDIENYNSQQSKV